MIGIGFDLGFTDTNVTAGAVVEFTPAGRALLLACLVFEPDMKLDWMQRIQSIGFEVYRTIKEYQPQFVSYEGAHIGAHAQTGLKLAHLCGAVLLAAGSVGAPIYIVQPSEAKKILATDGAADKDDMIAHARLKFGAAFVAALNQYPVKRHSHVADASGITLAGYPKHIAGLTGVKPAKKKVARRKVAATA